MLIRGRGRALDDLLCLCGKVADHLRANGRVDEVVEGGLVEGPDGGWRRHGVRRCEW